MHSRPFSLLAVALAVASAGVQAAPRAKPPPPPPAKAKVESPADLLKQARSRMKSLDFEDALPILARVGEHPAATPREKADAQVDIGICYVNIGDTRAARTAFGRALELDASAVPPSSAPPKVQQLFKSVSDERFAPPPPPPTPDVPLVTVAPTPTPVAPVAPVEPPPPSVTAPAPPAKSALPTVIGVGLGAVAVGGAVAGIVTAMESQRTAQALRSELRPGADAQALAQQQQTMSTVSIAAYVGAGVAAAGAVTAFILGGRSGGPAVAVVPTPGGLTAAAAVSF